MSSGQAGVPLAPVVKPEELWAGSPYVLLDGLRFMIGWQGWPEDEGGASFVTVRRSALGTLKVMERYPLNDRGWARAWKAFSRLDSGAARQVRGVLDARIEADIALRDRSGLDARSLASVAKMVFAGGYQPEQETLTGGRLYDLRFLEDRLAVYPHGITRVAAEFSYAEVQAVEVAGPGRVRRWSADQEAMLLAAFGVSGALFAYVSTQIKTFLRIQTAGSELFFLNTAMLPDDLRIHLSRGMAAVREAQTPGGGQQEPAAASPAGELLRLAGLLESGLLTREEFDHLKAKLIAGD